MYRQNRVVAVVDLAAIRHNGQIAKHIFPNKKILSVLKADAYGHGIAGVLPAYETFTDWYAVATLEEALLIRKNSAKPILVFGPIPQDKMLTAAENNITLTVGSLEYAVRLSDTIASAGIQVQCHLKIDTGLNRSGIRWREDCTALDQILKIRALPALHFIGTYTHLACGEGQEPWEIAHTKLQMKRFYEACEAMAQKGLDLGIRHCCSTGGSLINPDYQLDMVRLGMLPMGMSFSDESADELCLIPAMTWKSFIAQIETVAAGEAISYGCTFYAEKPMKIGIVTCGYADGYRRVYSNKSYVLVGGRKVPVLGRVAMDYTMIDLTEIEDVSVGSEVILLGSDGRNRVTALELSQYGESVSGEVTAAISGRVPRYYINSESR